MKFRSLLFLTAALMFAAVPLPLAAADVSIVPANVVPGARAKIMPGIAGAAVTAGQIVYLDAIAGTWKLADCDAGAILSGYGSTLGMAANSAPAAGLPISVITEDDDLTVGGTLVMTTPIYVLSGTAGGLAPLADLAAADYPVVLLIAKSPSKAIFRPFRGAVVVAGS